MYPVEEPPIKVYFSEQKCLPCPSLEGWTVLAVMMS